MLDGLTPATALALTPAGQEYPNGAVNVTITGYDATCVPDLYYRIDDGPEVVSRASRSVSFVISRVGTTKVEYWGVATGEVEPHKTEFVQVSNLVPSVELQAATSSVIFPASITLNATSANIANTAAVLQGRRADLTDVVVNWADLASGTLSGGHVSFTYAPKASYYYRVRVGAFESAPVLVGVKALMSAPTVSSAMVVAGNALTVSGTMRPYHTPGDASPSARYNAYFEKYNAATGKWTAPLGMIPCQVVDGDQAADTSRWEYTRTFGAAEVGRWRVYFQHSCGQHASGMSQPTEFVVSATADTSPPSVPSGVSAVALGPDSVRVSWASSTDVGGSGVKEYRVYDAATNTLKATVAASPATIGGLATGVAYSFVVKSVDNAGNESAGSSVVNAKPGTSASEQPSTVTVQQYITGIAYSGRWSNASSAKFSGGSVRYTTTRGARATATFRGTGIKVLGNKGRAYGKVDIAIDGRVAARGVNLYATTSQFQRTLFSKSGLADKAHTITITATLASKRVDVDALFVTGVAPGLNREHTTAAYSGSWVATSSAAYSGGSAKESDSTTASATFAFRGTGVTWIGSRGPAAGKAEVFVDGVSQGIVDLFAASPADQGAVWRTSGLADKNHSLKIVPTGTKADASAGSRVVVDAIVVR